MIFNFRFYDRLIIIAAIFFVMLVATSFVISAVSGLFPTENRISLLTGSVIQCILLFVVPALIGAKAAFGDPAKFLTLDVAPTLKSLMGVIVVYAIALPALNQIIYWNANIEFPEALAEVETTVKSMEENAQRTTSLMLDTSSIGGLLVNILVIGVLTGFSEELFFRGTLQRAGASEGAAITSVWVTALIFSIVHFQFLGFVPRLILGAWFGYLLYWTGSIYVAMWAHILNNSMVVITTWLTQNGVSDFNFEMLGVAESGFPVWGCISAILTALILYWGATKIFRNRQQFINNNNS